MPVVIFLLDNSASMNQMTHIGTTLFDIGKGAIEQFLKVSNPIFVFSYLILSI
jgi:integrator complex subunit 6